MGTIFHIQHNASIDTTVIGRKGWIREIMYHKPRISGFQQSEVIQMNFKELMPEMSKRNRATHYIHRYPAKLIPHIPNYLIKNFSKEGDTVLDPFCGSGTTLLESILCSRNALGVELNPVARLVAKVKITPLDGAELARAVREFRKKANICGLIEPPEFPNRDLWFSPEVQNELAKIKHTIDSMHVEPSIRNFLLVCFSAIVRKVSNADPRDIYPRLTEQQTQPDVSGEFLRQLDFNAKRISEIPDSAKASLIGDDAKKISLQRKVDMVVTSPPYLFAMEYFRSTRLENFWLSWGLTEPYMKQAKKSVNGELKSGITKKLQYTEISEIDDFVEKIYKISALSGLRTSQYFHDMQRVMFILHRIVVSGGCCAIVVGNSKVLENRVPLNRFLRLVGTEAGFIFEREIQDKIKSHRLMIKRSNRTSMIYNEHIVLLTKP